MKYAVIAVGLSLIPVQPFAVDSSFEIKHPADVLTRCPAGGTSPNCEMREGECVGLKAAVFRLYRSSKLQDKLMLEPDADMKHMAKYSRLLREKAATYSQIYQVICTDEGKRQQQKRDQMMEKLQNQ